jgi:cytochrome c oxidase subunit 1
MWRGTLQIKTPLLYAVGFIAMFIFGGLSGVSLATVPIDWQMQDTYYLVAHLHYVLLGGTVFGIFAGVYYWFPKMTGCFLNERIGKLQFWGMFIGFNLTFLPQHVLGIIGMPRRIYTYNANLGWGSWNDMSTIGSFVIALAVAVFVVNVAFSLRRREPAGGDPWGGHTLEWSVSSPPPSYNFAVIPTVHSRWPLLDHDGGGATITQPAPAAVHMPEGSIFPLVVSVGLMIACYGLVYLSALALVGVALLFGGVVAMVRERR